jgi:hypothetical protein
LIILDFCVVIVHARLPTVHFDRGEPAAGAPHRAMGFVHSSSAVCAALAAT